MNSRTDTYQRHRFPPDIIQYAVWLYFRFNLSNKSRRQAQRFLDVHAAVYNPFNLGRHLTATRHYRKLRQRAFAPWTHAVAA
jgi:hypothetical protein